MVNNQPNKKGRLRCPFFWQYLLVAAEDDVLRGEQADQYA
jgi:hypothetical protein